MAELIGPALYKGTSTVPDNPTIFTRFEKGQALTHAEMDTNLTSLFHTCSVERSSSIKEPEYVTLKYASQSLEDGQAPSFCRPEIKFQTMPSAQQVCDKIANETITGSLSLTGDLRVAGKLYVKDFIYESTASFVGEQSDARLKEHVSPFANSLDRVCQIEPVNFIWKEGAEKSGPDVGVIAQQVREIYPEAVHEGSDGYLRVDYTKFIPLLIGAFRDLSERYIRLEEKVYGR